MNTLELNQLDTVAGGMDLNVVPAAVGGGLLGAGYQVYNGQGLLSTGSLLWGLGGAALGVAGYYAANYAMDYFSGE